MAAQMLSGLGYKQVYNLKGGIEGWQGLRTSGPKELNMDLVRGNESPTEMVVLSYGMENGLQIFYEKMVQKIKNNEIKLLLEQLIEIEQNHKSRLRELYVKLEPSKKDSGALDSEAGNTIMEGGFNIEDFMQQNEPFLRTSHHVIDLAMMLETQALDLYLRFSQKTESADTKEVLFKLADEEKAHLRALGRWLEEKS